MIFQCYLPPNGGSGQGGSRVQVQIYARLVEDIVYETRVRIFHGCVNCECVHGDTVMLQWKIYWKVYWTKVFVLFEWV
jgi:hypothetical protein